MFYKNLLIISDNLALCVEVKRILDGLHLKDFNYTFSTSPFSNANLLSEKLDSRVITYNLKDDKHVDEIVEIFDLVFSIHCKQLFPPKLVESLKCINLHPGYNPINRGWYPQVFAIINDTKIGATIHEIDNKLDHGNIIARDFVPKRMDDTSESLYNRVLKKEIQLFNENIVKIINNDYSIVVPEDEGTLYLKSDFNKLCKIDLNEKVTMLEAINKLRALTHGEYKNAYFIDNITGDKVYTSIDFSKKSNS